MLFLKPIQGVRARGALVVHLGISCIHLDLDTKIRSRQDRCTHKQPRGEEGLNKHTALGFQWLYTDISIFLKHIYNTRWMQRCSGIFEDDLMRSQCEKSPFPEFFPLLPCFLLLD